MVAIRPVTRTDAPAVRDVLVQTWHATYDAWMGAEQVTKITNDWHAVERLQAQCAAKDAVFLLAEDGAEVVATSSARLDGETLHLDRLYVRPAWQRRGIGRDLLRATLERAGGPAIVRLEVDARNDAAIAFYQQHGFVVADRSDDDLIMERRPQPR